MRLLTMHAIPELDASRLTTSRPLRATPSSQAIAGPSNSGLEEAAGAPMSTRVPSTLRGLTSGRRRRHRWSARTLGENAARCDGADFLRRSLIAGSDVSRRWRTRSSTRATPSPLQPCDPAADPLLRRGTRDGQQQSPGDY